MKLAYEVIVNLPDVAEDDLGLALERASTVMAERLGHDEDYGFDYEVTYTWAEEVVEV